MREQLNPNLVLRFAWALCATQDSHKPNPMTLPVIKMISTVPRSAGLSQQELVDLHQVVGYTEVLTKKGVWPKAAAGWINPRVKEEAEKAYKRGDPERYPEVRKELAERIHQRGITLEETEYVGKMLRAEVMNKERTAAVVWASRHARNEDGMLTGREYMRRVEADGMRVVEINAEEWMKLEEKGKQTKVKEIVRAMEDTRRRPQGSSK